MASGPPSSKRCLLSELTSFEVGDKVRFLGCVQSYSTATATLALRHTFPKTTLVQASVDVNLLLRGLGVDQTDVGQWVHVIGYITSIQPASARRSTSASVRVAVQAIILWQAVELDLASYEASFELQKG